tara:strand:- start:38 stop:391 length:354 start_codon:yes stop_codon:yes gene_type:complete
MEDLYKFGYTGQSDVKKRFKECGYDVDVIFSWWLPYEMAYLGEQLILAVIEKDFYLVEQLDGITEMRKFSNKEKDRITTSLYDVKEDFLKRFPQYDVAKPWELKWKKLYFVKVLYNE